MSIENLKSQLGAKITIREANQSIKTAKHLITMTNQEIAEKQWNEVKQGKSEKHFYTNSSAKSVIAAAVAEVGKLSAGKPATSASDSNTPAEKIWTLEKAGVSQLFYKNETAKSVLKVAAAEVDTLKANGASAVAPAGSKPSQSVAGTVSAASSPRQISPATQASIKATLAVNKKPVATVVPAEFVKKPDFSALHGIARMSASMTWETSRNAWFLAEATKQVEAEEAAAKVVPDSGPITSQSIAKALLDEQAERSKPRLNPWSNEAAARKKKISDLAAKLKTESQSN